MRQRLGREAAVFEDKREVAVTSPWVDGQSAMGKGAENQAKRREPAPGFRLRKRRSGVANTRSLGDGNWPASI